MRPLLSLICLLAGLAQLQAESWPEALNRMPLPTNVGQLNRTNCAEVLLGAFQSNTTVKALLFMPGATDELYFFRRAQAALTNQNPTLLDAIVALTNQTQIRVVFHAPFLLLHSGEDMLELLLDVQHPATVDKLKRSKPLPHWVFYDRDWDALRKTIKGSIGPVLWPGPDSPDSRHFYRHTFAAWGLSEWEMLEAVAYTSRTRIKVRHFSVVFDPDERVGVLPKLDHFPRNSP